MAKKGTLFGKPRSQVIKRPGALKKKAAAAGKTVAGYCKGKHTGRTAKQCALAKTFRKWNR